MYIFEGKRRIKRCYVVGQVNKNTLIDNVNIE